MPDLNEFTFWKASCVQNPKNCIYPTKVIVTDADSFNEMAHFDHVTAEYENCYRSNDTFLNSDVQSGDVDNDNAENPDECITREDIHQIHCSKVWRERGAVHHRTFLNRFFPFVLSPFAEIESFSHPKRARQENSDS